MMSGRLTVVTCPVPFFKGISLDPHWSGTLHSNAGWAGGVGEHVQDVYDAYQTSLKNNYLLQYVVDDTAISAVQVRRQYGTDFESFILVLLVLVIIFCERRTTRDDDTTDRQIIRTAGMTAERSFHPTFPPLGFFLLTRSKL